MFMKAKKVVENHESFPMELAIPLTISIIAGAAVAYLGIHVQDDINNGKR